MRIYISDVIISTTHIFIDQSDEKTTERRQSQWKHAIAENTDALKERYSAT